MTASPFLYHNVNSDNARYVVEWVRRHSICLFCDGAMSDLGSITRDMHYQPSSHLQKGTYEDTSEEIVYVHRCARCGWWAARSPYLNTGGHIMMEVGYGMLRVLDPADLSEPVEAIRSYLVLRQEDMLKVHPRKFEEVVGSIFGDLGYRTRVTSYSGDGGIDVYMDGPDDTLIGVQVKRTKLPIEITQINALTGALYVNDCAAGVFVTTSRFRSGAVRLAAKVRTKGLPIELYDAKRLYEALGIAQTEAEFDPTDESAPWMNCEFGAYYKDGIDSLDLNEGIHTARSDVV